MAEDNTVLVRPYFAECLNRAGGLQRELALAVLDELLTDDFLMLYGNQNCDRPSLAEDRP